MSELDVPKERGSIGIEIWIKVDLNKSYRHVVQDVKFKKSCVANITHYLMGFRDIKNGI